MRENVIAIIPARSGSKTIADKNILQLASYPVLAYSIAAAKLSETITRVIVSTDSEDYANIATSYGAEVPFLRPPEFSTDTSTDRDFLIHAMNWIFETEGRIPEYWVHLRPSTPLREVKIIDNAIQKIILEANATSLRSGHKAPESPLKWFQLDDSGYFKGLIDGEENMELYNLSKQHFNTVYIPDGYVDVVKASHVMKNETIHGSKILAFESPVCTEIDSIEEFHYIEYQLGHKGSQLIDYLSDLKGKRNV